MKRRRSHRAAEWNSAAGAAVVDRVAGVVDGELATVATVAADDSEAGSLEPHETSTAAEKARNVSEVSVWRGRSGLLVAA